MNIEQRVELAYQTHHQGYNCAQSVFIAYLDILDISKVDAMKVAYGFGGGMGMTRELCGTLTGAAMILGQCYGKQKLMSNKNNLLINKYHLYVKNLRKFMAL